MYGNIQYFSIINITSWGSCWSSGPFNKVKNTESDVASICKN